MLSKLAYRFRKQEEFATGYSPLYAALFGAVAEWCENEPNDPLVTWLVETCASRSAFDVTLLLMAGVHREVLADADRTAETAVSALATFYPSVGGDASLGRIFAADGKRPSPALKQAFYTAIMARRAQLAPFLQTATVQTNETARGLIWLLPMLLPDWNWDAIHLVDLGASAGLNLLAEQRAYRLIQANSGATLADLGYGQPEQFQTLCNQSPILNLQSQIPKILSRTGGDIAPFKLETAVDEQTLSAFVWADQVPRFARLQEGIDVFRDVQETAVPVQLFPLDLPDGLPQFLQQHVPTSPHPVVIYNTYITMYLRDRGVDMCQHIADWASQQQRPVLWLQWEPPQHIGETAVSPDPKMLAWTADLWNGRQHKRQLLAWVHPHATRLNWLQT